MSSTLTTAGRRVAASARRLVRTASFPGSRDYWERRYRSGGNSGSGSFGQLAEFKAATLNQFVVDEDIASVVEFGCGDGNQLARLCFPRYLGLDVSPAAIGKCAERFGDDATKSFLLYDPASFHDPAGFATADLAMSIDVLYHLVEHDVWETHLRHLFAAGRRFVVLYAADLDDARPAAHVRHRPFSRWVTEHVPGWELTDVVPNPFPYDPARPTETTFAAFHVYRPIKR